MSKLLNMVKEKDVLQNIGKQDSFGVPQGYFERLQERLIRIPQSRENASERGVAAYLALAGSIAAVAIGGFAILKTTAHRDRDYIYEQLLYADAIPQTCTLYDAVEQAAALSEVSLEEYLNDINE